MFLKLNHIFFEFKGKAKLFKQICRTERAILNVVGPIGEQYFNELENYLNDKKFKVLKKNAWKGFRHHEEKEDPDLTSRQNKVEFDELGNILLSQQNNVSKDYYTLLILA